MHTEVDCCKCMYTYNYIFVFVRKRFNIVTCIIFIIIIMHAVIMYAHSLCNGALFIIVIYYIYIQ